MTTTRPLLAFVKNLLLSIYKTLLLRTLIYFFLILNTKKILDRKFTVKTPGGIFCKFQIKKFFFVSKIVNKFKLKLYTNTSTDLVANDLK